MKPIKFSFLLLLMATVFMSFQRISITPSALISTKWISPINDNCFESLCFTSDNTVMYYQCDENIYLELGYKIVDGKIEIEAYGKSGLEKATKLILTEDAGVMKQVDTQVNSFPRNFIKVPGGACN